MTRGVVSVAAVLLLAGCMGSEPAKDQSVPTTPSMDGGLNIQPIAPVVNEVRSVEAAPHWQSGEWWKYRVTDRFTNTVYETTRVVAGQEGDNYLVGMPRDAWVNDLMIFHVPGFGEILQADLSFEVHDVRFEPLQFPLVEGAKWDTAWEGQPITVIVHVTSATTAELTIEGAIAMTGLYDAELGEIKTLDIENYALVEVVDHGFDWAGVVTVPHMHDLVFINFRFGPVFGPDGLAPTPFGNLNPVPTEDVVLEGTYDRVSFAIILGSFSPVPEIPAAPGFYSETATAPDGTEYKLEMLPTESGLKIKTFEHSNPIGTWTFTHVSAGVGIALTEGIAYHVYDVRMPEGCVLPSEGEHPHGGCDLGGHEQHQS